ncbi:MAG: flagellar biosynthesis anti-sigma factor FlgM [Desulfuromonas sp.]|nr:flagellar biosynthesis anti-sigma factor FlgM [Desulfuromonas sp.]
MTMRINNDKSLLQQSALNKVRTDQSGAKEPAKAQNTDKVSFSSVLQQASQTQQLSPPVGNQSIDGLNPALLNTPTYVQDVSETQETARASKIEELKLQVADGSYQPDLKKVASSLLTFLAEGRQS